jgi:hypothetical protein
MIPEFRNIAFLDWITVLFFLSLVLIALGKYFYKPAFYAFLALPFNNKYIALHKKKGKLVNGFHIFLTIFQLINNALLLYLAKNLFMGVDSFDQPSFYAMLLLILFAFLMLKLFLQMANGFFFENYELMTDTIFEKLSYWNYAGLIAFLGNLMLIFAFRGSKTLIIVTLSLMFLTISIGWINGLRNRQNLIFSNTLYFILYLCALEIAPLAIFIGYLKG